MFGTNTFIVPVRQAADVAAWLAAAYEVQVAFDTDLNGILDEKEQAELAQALEDDTVPLPLFAPLLLGKGHHAAITYSTPVLFARHQRCPGLSGNMS